MHKANDTYKTIAAASTAILLKEKKSKFYAIAYPIQTEAEVKPLIEALKKKHQNANHVCYAWQIGIEKPSYRANDDGEPHNSAGMPIYGQILAFDLKNILVAVTRVFGGTKLGVGGLISAYRTAAQMTLETATITIKTISTNFEIHFGYPEMSIVMRTIKQNNYQIISQQLEINCVILVSIRKGNTFKFKAIFQAIQNVSIKEK